MNNKVYIVTSGEYSDYRIVAVFSTREKAEQLLNKIESEPDYDTVDIEEYSLDKFKPSSYIHRIEYDSKEDLWECEFIRPYRDNYYDDEIPNKINVETKYQKWIENDEWKTVIDAPRFIGADPYYIYTIYINEPDRDRALKIGTEKIMQYIARGTHGDNK